MVTYFPSSDEYVLTGIFGLCLFGLLMAHAGLTLRRGVKSKSSRVFFYAIVLMSFLEMPRYLELALAGQYDSRVCYCFHILSGTVFFAAFSIVAHQWSGLLSLASYFRAVYGRRALLIANGLFAVFDVFSISMCLASPSLQFYFMTEAFSVIILLEALRNVVYSGFLAYFGVSLVCRFSHYASLATSSDLPLPLVGPISSSSGSGSTSTSSSSSSSSSNSDGVFGRAVLRLTVVLVLVLLCFTLRAAMLIAKLALLQKEKGETGLSASLPTTSPQFPLFGFFFFTLTDFIPRCVPASAFIYLMGRGVKSGPGAGAGSGAGGGSKRVSLSGKVNAPLAARAAGTTGPSDDDDDDDYQFVRLAGDERELARQQQEQQGLQIPSQAGGNPNPRQSAAAGSSFGAGSYTGVFSGFGAGGLLSDDYGEYGLGDLDGDLDGDGEMDSNSDGSDGGGSGSDEGVRGGLRALGFGEGGRSRGRSALSTGDFDVDQELADNDLLITVAFASQTQGRAPAQGER